MRVRWRDDRGAAIAEFTMVAGLLTLVTLAVIQLGLAMYVRNVVADAAAEGARYASLVGGDHSAGTERAGALIASALGEQYTSDIVSGVTEFAGYRVIEVRVTATLPLLGLIGPEALEVSGHAPVEVLDEN